MGYVAPLLYAVVASWIQCDILASAASGIDVQSLQDDQLEALQLSVSKAGIVGDPLYSTLVTTRRRRRTLANRDRHITLLMQIPDNVHGVLHGESTAAMHGNALDEILLGNGSVDNLSGHMRIANHSARAIGNPDHAFVSNPRLRLSILNDSAQTEGSLDHANVGNLSHDLRILNNAAKGLGLRVQQAMLQVRSIGRLAMENYSKVAMIIFLIAIVLSAAGSLRYLRSFAVTSQCNPRQHAFLGHSFTPASMSSDEAASKTEFFSHALVHMTGSRPKTWLVVPSNTEFHFAVPDCITTKPQQMAMNIMDLVLGDNIVLAKIRIQERGVRVPGIYLSSVDNAPIAHVRTGSWFAPQRDLPDICEPSGEVCCRLMRNSELSGGRWYHLVDTSGGVIFMFYGDYLGKIINVVDVSGCLVGATKPSMIDSHPYYQARISQHIDAGLLICALLAIQKVEGSSFAT